MKARKLVLIGMIGVLSLASLTLAGCQNSASQSSSASSTIESSVDPSAAKEDNSTVAGSEEASESADSSTTASSPEEDTSKITADSDEYLEYANVLQDVFQVRAGSAGESLRAEEAAKSLKWYIEQYGKNLCGDDYMNMTQMWLEEMVKDDKDAAEELRENLDAVDGNSDLADVDGYSTLLEGTVAGIDASGN